MQIAFCSSDLVAYVKERFLTGGVEGAVAEATEDETIPYWQIVVCGWVLHKTPQDFGYFRTRWSCEILAELLAEQHGIQVSSETLRRGLHALGFDWRRPRPVVGPIRPVLNPRSLLRCPLRPRCS